MSQTTIEDRCRGVLISLTVAPQRARQLVSYWAISNNRGPLPVIQRKVLDK